MTNFLSGSEKIAEEIYSFYVKEFENHQLRILIVCGVGIFFVLIGIILLIPIVFKVLRTNNMVMDLFAKIKGDDIKKLAEKCDKFLTSVLAEQKEEKKTLEQVVKHNALSNEESSKLLHGSKTHQEEGGEAEEFDTRTQKPQGNLDLMSEDSQKKMETQLVGRRGASSTNSNSKKNKEDSNQNNKKKNKKKKKADKEDDYLDDE